LGTYGTWQISVRFRSSEKTCPGYQESLMGYGFKNLMYGNPTRRSTARK
jgi:hypothetical protein